MSKSKSTNKASQMRSFPRLRADAGNGAPVKAVPPTPQGLSKMISKAELELRNDSWENVLSGIGVRGHDSRTASRLAWSGLMREEEAEQTYAGDSLARRIVEVIPRMCLKNWIKFTGMDAFTQGVDEELYRLKAPERLFQAACWAKMYGGAGIFMATGEDPAEFEKPLDPNNFKRVESLVVFSRWELQVRSTDLETDINDPNYANPKFYRLTPRKGNVSQLFTVKIHHSRIIRFDGEPLPLRLKVFNQYWGESVYTGVKESLADYGLSHASMAHVLQQFRQVIYSMKDLVDNLSSPNSEDLQRRLAKLNAVRSVLGMWVMDEDESLDIKSDTFTGVKDMLQALKERLQACTNIPHIVLFNESPSAGGGGMGQTGDASMETWYDYLQGEQGNYYTEKIDQLLVTMLQAPEGPTQGQEPEGWDWEFNPIHTLDAGGKADLETKQLSNTQTRMNMGVDDAFDAMERHNPDKFKQLNLAEGDRIKAAFEQVVNSELERRADPEQTPQIPTNIDPLVKERDKVVVPATPRNSNK